MCILSRGCQAARYFFLASSNFDIAKKLYNLPVLKMLNN